MTRIYRFSFFLLIPALLLLASCGSGGGYHPWEYKNVSQAPAQAAPSPLSDIYGDSKYDPAPPAGPPPQQANVERFPLEDENTTLTDENKFPVTQTYHSQSQPPAQSRAQPQQPQYETSRSVKVALLLPLSGQHKHLGQAMLKAAQMALFDISKGGIELLPRDTRGTSQGARSAAQTAINEGAQLILGPVFAPAVRAAKSVTQRANVNMIAFSTDWTLSGGNTFIMGFLPFDQVERVINYAGQQGIHRIGVLSPSSEYGNAVLSAYRSMATRAGIETVDISLFSPGSRNISPTVRSFAKYDERIAAAKMIDEMDPQPAQMPFDAVLMPIGGDLLKATANLLSQYDLPPRSVRRLGTGLWDDPGLTSDPSLEGGWFAAPSPRARNSFESRFNTLYGAQPTRLSSLAYDATALAAVLAQTGMKQYGQTAFDKRAITNPNGFTGIDGIFRFRSDGIVERGLAILEFRRGRIVVVDEAPRTFQQQRY